MAPMKYEEQLKDKLEQRNIQPSVNSWQKLSKKLDVKTLTKNSKNFWYLGIAASIVGIILITKVFNEDHVNIVNPTIVNTNNNVLEPIDSNKEDVDTTIGKERPYNEAEVLASESDEIETTEKTPTNHTGLKQKTKKERIKIFHKKPDNTFSVAKRTDNKDNELVEDKLSIEELKAKEVVAQIRILQKTNEVSNAQIDDLLNAAYREIALTKHYNEDIKTVDANALLLSVEDEIEEQTFRTRVLEILKSGYKEVKTVVAQRNN